MQDTLKEAIQLFLDNKEQLQKAFKWDSAYVYPLCSLIFTSKLAKIHIDKLKEADQIIKSKTGAFSGFRGNTRMAMMAQMAIFEDMGAYFDAVQCVYDKLKAKKKWFESDYSIVAAMVIVQNENDESKYDALVEKTTQWMEAMKKQHPWLTGTDDIGFAALLAASGLDTDAAMTDMEKSYQILKDSKKFGSANGIQSLSHALSLELGNIDIKCQRVIDLYEGLKEKKKKYGLTYELSSLGALALTDVDVRELVEQIAETDDYLKEQKGFGALGIGSEQRLMYASMLVMQQYTAKLNTLEAATLTGVVGLIIAQEVALIAAITATTIVTTVH